MAKTKPHERTEYPKSRTGWIVLLAMIAAAIPWYFLK